jgi:predicted acetyltransferase
MSLDVDDPATAWHVRAPEPDELAAFSVPVQLAFGGDLGEAELEDWLKLAEPERWLGAFESSASSLVGGVASAYSMRLTVPGGEVPVAAVTGVGVRPDHRRRGILRALMERQLADVRERGEPMAVLWASESAIYARFGYGLATFDGYFEVETTRTAFAQPRPPEGRVRIVDEDEAISRIPSVYDAMRRTTPGALSRSQEWWRQVMADAEYSRHGAGPKQRVIFEVDGRAEGYALYRIRDDWDERGPKAILEVPEAIATSPRATRELWRYLFDVDLVRTVKATRVALPSPLQHLLADPRALGLVVRDGMWLRLVDMPAALGARRYGAADELVFDVRDDLCPWNTGRWRMRTVGDAGSAEARVERSEAPADLELETADLATIYLGGVRLPELAAAGRVSERTPGALLRADAVFHTERAPWCSMMF